MRHKQLAVLLHKVGFKINPVHVDETEDFFAIRSFGVVDISLQILQNLKDLGWSVVQNTGCWVVFEKRSDK